jgi:hypothetical protein
MTATKTITSTSQDQIYTNFLKLVGDKDAAGPEAADGLADGLYKFNLSRPNGQVNLDAITSVVPPPQAAASTADVEAMSTSHDLGFSRETAANGSILNLWSYKRFDLSVLGCNKQIAVNSG